MDNVREKLVELLREVQYLGGLEEKLADHMIANGVTVQEWIPLTERLPTKEDANEFDEILTVTRKGTVTPYYYDRVAYYQKDFPYWMPWSALPTPPKGE